jgi:hypothetical protein
MTNIIHGQKKSVKVAQKIAGHVLASTTLIYDEPPEESLKDALQQASFHYYQQESGGAAHLSVDQPRIGSDESIET